MNLNHWHETSVNFDACVKKTSSDLTWRTCLSLTAGLDPGGTQMLKEVSKANSSTAAFISPSCTRTFVCKSCFASHLHTGEAVPTGFISACTLQPHVQSGAAKHELTIQTHGNASSTITERLTCATFLDPAARFHNSSGNLEELSKLLLAGHSFKISTRK